ncbi:MAG: polyprenyl diphosphate synthase [Patescibacteria group bacterium]
MDTPQHIGIIMDGNRRWARAHGLPLVEGHRRGLDNIRTSLRWCLQHGVRMLTVFAFSTENWNRPPEEVKYLMKLFLMVIKKEVAKLDKEGIRYAVVGRIQGLSRDIQNEIKKAVKKTAHNSKLVFTMALNYGGRAEIVDAIKSIVGKKIPPAQITESLVAKNLYAPDVPDPDLIIRTSGENRLSGFLLWESAYSELYFTPTLWPDFGTKDLDAALQEFKRRQRRFGK